VDSPLPPPLRARFQLEIRPAELLEVSMKHAIAYGLTLRKDGVIS